MLIDTINYFNALSNHDQVLYNNIIDFSYQFIANTLPSLTCVYGNTTWVKLLCNTLVCNTMILHQLDETSIQFIKEYDDYVIVHDIHIPTLKKIISKEDIVVKRYLELPKIVHLKAKVIIVSQDVYCCDDEMINSKINVIHLPINKIKLKINDDDFVNHIRILPLLSLWYKLQYLKLFLIDDVIRYTLLLI